MHSVYIQEMMGSQLSYLGKTKLTWKETKKTNWQKVHMYRTVTQ